MKASKKIKLELLAPAKNATIAIEAIKHGADAVYMGANRYGARAMAGNSIEDISRVVDFAHKFNAKVYITINTILYDNELNEVEKLIHQLYKIGVDALIIQDMSILRLNLPPIALHASTQCDIRTPEKAQFLEKCGMSQLVLARELSLDEINKIREVTTVPLEAFIHGALCVSYSGRCGLSYACMKRSANRGECAQMCRLPYHIEDDKGNIIADEKHYLSLKDLNQSSNLRDMINAGVSSFKIEGRLKDVVYVKNVVAYYRTEIDNIIANNNDKYERSSIGDSIIKFTPQLDKVFNRSFSSYFLIDRNPKNGVSMASLMTPKSMGEYIGTVISLKHGNVLRIDTDKKLANGDGLSFFDDGVYTGVRVNKVEGNNIILSNKLKIAQGVKLFRTQDKLFTDAMNGVSAERFIRVNLTLRNTEHQLILDVLDERGISCTTTLDLEQPLEKANTLQASRQDDILRKLGATIYKANEVKTLGEYFIPSSILTDLRRKAIELLDKTNISSYAYDYRKPEKSTLEFPYKKLSHTDNVSNKLSREFYLSHGVTQVQSAIEFPNYNFTGDEVLMHTRYCILRELGHCRKSSVSNKLPSKLYLVNSRAKLLIETDCANCEMKIKKVLS